MESFGLDMPPFAPGSVWLAGAGPGDPGLLSLYALHGLRHADIVVHDALVDRRILDLAGDGAVLEYAGKRGGKPSPTQPDISRRLIRHARDGRRVLRLKGGDPLVFGRGGEEALALAAAHIPFRLIPGITAGIGGLAYAGIAATHRGVNSSVTFVTGFSAAGDVDWAALAKGAPALVVYMALNNLADITARLIAAGRDTAEPVAVISKATTPDQRVIETTLGEAAAAAKAAEIDPPALVVIGEIVRLRAGLDWLDAATGRTLDPNPVGPNSGGPKSGGSRQHEHGPIERGPRRDIGTG